MLMYIALVHFQLHVAPLDTFNTIVYILSTIDLLFPELIYHNNAPKTFFKMSFANMYVDFFFVYIPNGEITAS